MVHPIHIFPIGIVRRQGKKTWIELKEDLVEGLLGLEAFSHIVVLYWLHHNDTPTRRAILQVRPKKKPTNPLTGVFATHSPVRPNLIALTICKIVSIEHNTIFIRDMDAQDGSPVLDIKCYRPSRHDSQVRIPDWAADG
jgi:tRNA-Thr(GGU) m(6)t(6)A37 methyltransferase TsaA